MGSYSNGALGAEKREQHVKTTNINMVYWAIDVDRLLLIQILMLGIALGHTRPPACT
ncbi:MAG: hypothetical protein ACJASB_001007 [Shewanella psychromarinicola]|jgi:hypothetical protein